MRVKKEIFSAKFVFIKNTQFRCEAHSLCLVYLKREAHEYHRPVQQNLQILKKKNTAKGPATAQNGAQGKQQQNGQAWKQLTTNSEG